MSNTEETQNETTQDTNCTKVNTGYARACIILLALNFCLTGYVLNSIMNIQASQTGATEETAPTATASAPSTTPQASQESDEEEVTTGVKTSSDE